MNKKKIAINMVFSVIAFVLNLGINFFITPYITSQFGSDAYGFVKLANDFTNYASLFSIALNSMASRFLMMERVKGNIKAAQKYFSSITFANILLSAILLIPSIICIVLLEKFLVIPTILIVEVKLTFAVTFAAFLANLFFSTYSNCYYLTNELSIGSVRDAIMNIIRILTIVLLFMCITPRISFVAVGSLISTIFAIVYNFIYTKKLTPEFNFNYRDFDWTKLRQVLSSGIWNSITKLSQIFSSGLDLIISNVFIGSTEMGYLAVAKTVPTLMNTFNSTVANVYSPDMMALYAKGDMKELKRTAKTSMKFMSLFVTIPSAILITMGVEFYQLWTPEQPAKILCILSILTVVITCVTGPLTPLYQIFTITNKIKQSSIVVIVYGFVSVIVTIICLKTTSWGILAVATVSLIGAFIVALCYHLPFSAIYIGLPWYAFFPEIGKSVLSLIVQCVLGWCINILLPLEKSWILWFVGAIVAAGLGLILNVLLILNRQEKKILIDKFLSKNKKAKQKNEKNFNCE